MKIKKERILPSLLCLLLAWAAASCREEVETQEGDKQGHIVTLNIDFGDKNTPQTPRTRAGVPDDQIDEIDVLTFIADPNEPDNIDKGIFHHRAQAELSTGADGKMRAKVRLFGNSDMHQHILVLANVRQRLNAMTLTYGMEALTALNPLHSVYVGAGGKVDDSRPIPMAGILPRQVIDESYAASEKEVTMLRMFAKITVDPGQENMHELHLYNGRQTGRVIPYNQYYDKVNKAVTSTPWGWIVIPGPVDYSPAAPGREKIAFYTNEVDNSHKAGNLMDVTYLTVKATHKGGAGAPSWYRIDLKDYATGNFFDILRNREYYIKLNESGQVQEPGGATEEDARQGLHKLNVEIISWIYKGAVVQAQGDPTLKKLAVVESALTIDGADGSLLNIYADGGGWNIHGLPSWAQVSQASGGNGWTQVRISSLEQNLTRTDRQATIRVQNGRASMTVQLTQPDACTLQPNGQPRQLKIRGQNYHVARLIPGGRCWMLDAYREPTNMYRPANGMWGPLYTPAWDMPPVSDGWRIPNTADIRDFLDSPYIRLRDKTPANVNPVLGRIYSSGRGFVENGTGYHQTDFAYNQNNYVNSNNVVIILVNGKEQYIEIPASQRTCKLNLHGIKLPEIKDFTTWTDGAGVQQYSWNYLLPTGEAEIQLGHTYLFLLPALHINEDHIHSGLNGDIEITGEIMNQFEIIARFEIGTTHENPFHPIRIYWQRDTKNDHQYAMTLHRKFYWEYYHSSIIIGSHMFKRGPVSTYYPGNFPFHIPAEEFSYETYSIRPYNRVEREGTSASLTEMGGSIRLVHD